MAGRNPLLVLVRVFARRQIFINLDRFEHEEGAEEATDETFFGRKKTTYVFKNTTKGVCGTRHREE